MKAVNMFFPPSQFPRLRYSPQMNSYPNKDHEYLFGAPSRIEIISVPYRASGKRCTIYKKHNPLLLPNGDVSLRNS
jgi:hypothetical protein